MIFGLKFLARVLMQIPLLIYICCAQQGNVLPDVDTCGKISPALRITSGVNARENEFPWMALLVYKRPQNLYHRSVCAGSLINTRYVVTAGHCLNQPELVEVGAVVTSVRLGNWNISWFSNGIQVDVEQRIPHSGFHWVDKKPRNDIALLRLKQPVRYTRSISPICVSTPSGYYTSNSWENKLFQIAGWGRTEGVQSVPILRKSTLNGRNLQVCQNRYTTAMWHQTQVCAGGLDGRDTCEGDSGSPLMFTVHTSYNQYVYLAGITSFGPSICGWRGRPSVYTRAAVYVDWIKNTIRA